MSNYGTGLPMDRNAVASLPRLGLQLFAVMMVVAPAVATDADKMLFSKRSAAAAA